MGELQFAKQYLTTLDGKNTKFQPDHVFDPQTFQLRIPYTLPKFPHPPYPTPVPLSSTSTTTEAFAPPPGSSPAAANEPSITITLTSPRNPTLNLTLPNLAPSTTLTTIRTAIQTHLGGPSILKDTSKIKIIHNKKPIPSSKPTLGEAFSGTDAEGQTEVKLGVMILGGAPDPPAAKPDEVSKDVGPESEQAAAEKVAADAGAMEGVLPASAAGAEGGKKEEGEEKVLEGEEFWEDLQGFLAQRLNSVEKARELRGRFERAWRSGEAKP